MRTQPRNSETIRSGWLGHLRSLHVAFPVVLGSTVPLVTTPSGLPVGYALAGAKDVERYTALDMIAFGGLDTAGQTLIADKGNRWASVETGLNAAGVTLIRPNLKTEYQRAGDQYLRAFRQIIES